MQQSDQETRRWLSSLAMERSIIPSLPRKLSCRFPLYSLAFGFSSGAKRASKWRRKVRDKNLQYIKFCYHHFYKIPFCYFPPFVPFTSISFGEFMGKALARCSRTHRNHRISSLNFSACSFGSYVGDLPLSLFCKLALLGQPGGLGV